MPRYVPGSGNASAQLMVVGEAPGAREEEEGIPFVGPSGAVVDDCLQAAGLSRSEVYVTNVVKIRPPNNEIFRLPELGVKIEDFEQELWNEIESIKPNCILAFGNTALKALTGFTGIQKYRGSILTNKRLGLPKIVPSIHPASLFHSQDGEMKSYRDRAFIQFDVVRAVQQSRFREHRPPERVLTYAKNSLDLIRFLDRHIGMGRRHISYDIETFKAIPMCISFAFSRYESLSVPLFDIAGAKNPDGISMRDMTFIWQIIADLLLDPQYKLIGHNLKFDQGRLEEIGLPCNDPYFDTQLGFHIMYPELPKKLQFVCSILTEEPYYKDELEEYDPRKTALRKRLLYNAKDSAVTFEVYEREVEELTEMGMMDFMLNKQMPLHGFYHRLERRGLNIDKSERSRLIKKYERYSRWIDKSLERDLTYKLNVNSPKQVFTTLYGDLKCPKRANTEEETLTMLMLNAVKDPLRRRIINNILKGRKSRKTESTYVKAKLYPDGRMRTTYNICGTETGRTSTSKPKPPVTAEPMGVAFQTLTKHGDVGADLRKMYIVTPGKVLLEADGSQAEARVVALLAHDEVAMRMMNRTDFQRNKFGIKDDIHTWTTQLVTGAAFEAIDDELRQIGKKTRHAGNYAMGKRRLSLLAQISEWKAGKCLEAFHDNNPNIKNVFWEEVRQALQDNDKILFTPHGRRRMFFDRWGEDLFKEAYAYIPQGTVSDHTKFAGIRVETRASWIEMVQESHDSFMCEVPSDDKHIFEAARIIREELETPIDFSRCSLQRGELVIPCDVSITRTSWKKMGKLKID